MKVLLYYLMFGYTVFVTSYIFYFYNELHRRETCAMLATTFKIFVTCIDQPWQDYEKIELARFMQLKITELEEGIVYSDEH